MITKIQIKAGLKVAFWVLIFVVTYLLLREMPVTRQAFPYMDKLQHIFVFGVLTTVAGLVFSKRLWLILFVLVFYGGLMEVMQAKWTFTRHASVGDWAADVVGILLAMGLLALLRWWRSRLRK